MNVVIIFLLAVLFVAAVWGREAAQKLFKGGMAVGAFVFTLAVIGLLLIANNLQAPSQSDIRRDLSATYRSPYYVPYE